MTTITAITAILPAYNEKISIGSAVLYTRKYADRTTEIAELVGVEIKMKPQIHTLLAELSACYARGCAGNADECRSIAIIHRKGREERKVEAEKSLRPLRLIKDGRDRRAG